MSTPEGFEVWSKYEDVAMHFNGLLIQFRVQVLGGLTALTTIGGYLVGEKVHERRQRYGVMSLYAFVFGAAWTAAAALDLMYYRQLLRGAVDALLRLEAKSKGALELSTTLEGEMGYGNYGPFLFYGIVLLALLGVFVWSSAKYLDASKAETPRATTETAASPEIISP